MAFTPKFTAKFTKPLIRQIIALIQRDIRPALDIVGGEGVLPEIMTYQLSPIPIPQYPALLIVPERTVFIQDAVGTLQSSARVYVAIAVTHQDGQVLAELIQDYVEALDMVFNSLELSDFYKSWPLTLPMLVANQTSPPVEGSVMTNALALGTVKELFVVSHMYDELQRIRSGYGMAARLEILIDREET